MLVIYGKTQAIDNYHLVHNDSDLTESQITRLVEFPSRRDANTFLNSSKDAFVKLLDENMVLLGDEYGADRFGRKKPIFALTTFRNIYDYSELFFKHDEETEILQSLFLKTSDPRYLAATPPCSELNKELSAWLTCSGYWIGENPVTSQRWNDDTVATYKEWLLHFDIKEITQAFFLAAFSQELLIDFLDRYASSAPFSTEQLAELLDTEDCFHILSDEALQIMTAPEKEAD